ncbi:Oidioi.mRNA.OKI2018_I69.chr1.g620.t1.cds [Oikopleura dioica]|uniref:Oidioi.mRNA.OKI2018_I69.chr1.g620.t1.cds n=1 Tax=Oikopleura dioica TaxID=34765 RepID=A0ABN7SKF5_OIKDI|nr:Oidioi.mRNA.OKI2018_I69.chr1.g620.t1.cds [Oikopleura dioica]
MNFLSTPLFFFAIAAASQICTENFCRACSLIDGNHHFCRQIQKSKCCEAWGMKSHHSLVPSATEKAFVEVETPEIFQEKEGSTFSKMNILVICFSFVIFVVFIIQLERIIENIVKKPKAHMEDKFYLRSNSESSELLL